MAAARSHWCTLTSQEAVSALTCADQWPVLVCPLAAAKQMAPAVFSSPLLSENSNLCFLLLPNQKMSIKSYRHVFILEIYNAFLFWLRLTDRLRSSCKALWEKNKDRQTDSNGMTLISLGNQAKNENVTSDPLLRASPLKARTRTDISQIRKDMWRLPYSCYYIKGVKKRN